MSPSQESLSRIAVLLAASLTLPACGGGGLAKKEATLAPARDPRSIVATEAVVAQIKVGEPPWGDVAGSLRVPGRVEADATRIAMVNSPITGRIVDLEVVEGQSVQRGQVIAVIRSTELSDARMPRSTPW